MPIPRFHIPFALPREGRIPLPDGVAQHAGRALRLPAGAPILLFDGTGGAMHATLAFDGRQAVAELLAHDPTEAELRGSMTLVQGIAAGDKMDWIVEKAVELGVSAIVPIAAQRSVTRLAGARLDKRLEHWRRTVTAACEQCGRNRLPVVHAPLSLRAWLATPADGELRLLCHPQADVGLVDTLAAHAGTTAVSLLVGPEGGWSDDELAAADAAGVVRVRHGARVLRTETAGLALVAAASALLGWTD